MPDIVLCRVFQEVSGCLVVNPSRLSRGQVGGSYARLRVPASDRDLAPELFSAQVLKTCAPARRTGSGDVDSSDPVASYPLEAARLAAM